MTDKALPAALQYATSKRRRGPTPVTIMHLKEIPIKRVAEALGMNLRKVGGKDDYHWRDPLRYGKVTSLTIFGATNTFVRFSGKESGGRCKGTNIDLVMYMTDNPSIEDACKFLKTLL